MLSSANRKKNRPNSTNRAATKHFSRPGARHEEILDVFPYHRLSRRKETAILPTPERSQSYLRDQLQLAILSRSPREEKYLRVRGILRAFSRRTQNHRHRSRSAPAGVSAEVVATLLQVIRGTTCAVSARSRRVGTMGPCAGCGSAMAVKLAIGRPGRKHAVRAATIGPDPSRSLGTKISTSSEAQFRHEKYLAPSPDKVRRTFVRAFLIYKGGDPSRWNADRRN